MQNEREKQMEQMLRKIEDNLSRQEAAFIYRKVIAGILEYQSRSWMRYKNRFAANIWKIADSVP